MDLVAVNGGCSKGRSSYVHGPRRRERTPFQCYTRFLDGRNGAEDMPDAVVSALECWTFWGSWRLVDHAGGIDRVAWGRA